MPETQSRGVFAHGEVNPSHPPLFIELHPKWLDELRTGAFAGQMLPCASAVRFRI